MMKREPMFMAVAVLVCVTVFNINLSPPLASDIVTIIGEVNETNQIIVDGAIYEVDDTPVGNDLVKNYIHGGIGLFNHTAFPVATESIS